MVKTEGLLAEGTGTAPPIYSIPAKANVYPNNTLLFSTPAAMDGWMDG